MTGASEPLSAFRTCSALGRPESSAACTASPDVAGFGADVVPVAVFRDLKSVRFGEAGKLLVASLVNDLLVFLVPDIADALEEQQREDVRFKVSRIHRAAQDVGGFPEVAFELAEGDSGQRTIHFDCVLLGDAC